MRPAAWTLSPMEEREHARRTRAVARANWGVPLALFILLASCPLSCLSLYYTPFGTIPALVGFVGAAVWVARTVRRRDAALHEAWERDAEMIDEFGPGLGWPVALVVHQGDAPTGQDRGMLWIEEGRLLFAGRRTSFALSAQDVVGRCHLLPEVAGLHLVLKLRLRSRTPAGPLGLSMAPLVQAKWQSGVTANDVHEAIERWLAAAVESPGGMPPTAIGPEAPTPTRLFLRAAVAIGFWSALGTSVLGLALTHRWLFAAATGLAGLALGTAWSALWSPGARLRAWRDRRRIG